MKNLFSGSLKNVAFLLFILLIFTSAVRHAAAQSEPFEKIVISKDTELFDDTADQGPNNQPIQYVENFGAGYSYIGDCVVLRDMDFSGKQAKAVSVFIANGDEEILNLSVHVGDMNNEPAAVINVLPTGGFTREKAMMFAADFDVPIEGKATVYIKWQNKTGNLFEVEFFDEYINKDESFTEIKTDYSDSPPPTGDDMIVFAMLSASAIFAAALMWKKRNN